MWGSEKNWETCMVTTLCLNLAFTVSVEIQLLMTGYQNIDLISFRSGDDTKWAIYNTRQPTSIYLDHKYCTLKTKIKWMPFIPSDHFWHFQVLWTSLGVKSWTVIAIYLKIECPLMKSTISRFSDQLQWLDLNTGHHFTGNAKTIASAACRSLFCVPSKF